MKSRIKIVIAFLVIIVLLAGAIVTLKLTEKPAESTDTASSETAVADTETSRLLYDKDPKDIRFINITNDKGSYEIERFGKDDIQVWTIAELYETPINYETIDSIVEAASSVTVQQTVLENAEDLSVYGLDKPTAVIKTTFTDNDNTVKEIYIGNPTPKPNKTYMCFAGENTVYTVNTEDFSCFLEDKYSCITKTVYNLFVSSDENDTNDYSKINKMTISRKDIDYDIVIEYDKRLDDPDAVVGNSSNYIMTSPVNLDINPEKSNDVTGVVFGLTASEVAVITPDDAQKGKHGLADPYAEITMDIAGGDFHMIIGNETPEKTGRYCMAQDLNVIYIFDNASLPWLSIMPLDITNTIITSNYIFDLTGLQISGSGINADFAISGSSADDFAVKLNGEDVNADAFKSFYQYILKAPAEELCFDNQGIEPVLDIKIITENSTDELTFYNLADRRTAVALNGRVSFTLKTAYIERLIENYHLFENGEDIISSW